MPSRTPVWEALARQDRDGTPGPRYVDLMHETLAVAMATGYGLVTGRPQLVLLHAGPGLLQGACGIHGALLAQVGMVICSAESLTYGEGGVDGRGGRVGGGEVCGAAGKGRAAGGGRARRKKRGVLAGGRGESREQTG